MDQSHMLLSQDVVAGHQEVRSRSHSLLKLRAQPVEAEQKALSPSC
jgi:hypothetical protein